MCLICRAQRSRDIAASLLLCIVSLALSERHNDASNGSYSSAAQSLDDSALASNLDAVAGYAAECSRGRCSGSGAVMVSSFSALVSAWIILIEHVLKSPQGCGSHNLRVAVGRFDTLSPTTAPENFHGEVLRGIPDAYVLSIPLGIYSLATVRPSFLFA